MWRDFCQICRFNQEFQVQKQILLPRFIEGLKLDEIAEIMNMPLNSVKSHVHRGRKKHPSHPNYSTNPLFCPLKTQAGSISPAFSTQSSVKESESHRLDV